MTPARSAFKGFDLFLNLASAMLLLGAFCLVSTPAVTRAAEFIPLEIDLSGANRNSLLAKGISVSEDGAIVVATSAGVGPTTAGLPGDLIRWTRTGGYEVLAKEVAIGAVMSGDGSKIAGHFRRDGQTPQFSPFLISDDVLSDLPIPQDATASRVYGISQDGTTVVGSSVRPSNTPNPATVWVDGQISLMPTDKSIALDASANGSVITLNGAARWTAANGVESYPLLDGLDPPPLTLPSAVGLSSDGRWTVGRQSFTPIEGGRPPIGLIWDGLSSPRVLDTHNPAWGSMGIDVTRGGVVIGHIYLDGSDLTERIAGYWTEATGMIPLQDLLVTKYGLADELVGWKLLSAYDITDDGRFIAGSAIDSSGSTAAFLVDLGVAIPEPSGALLLAGGLIGVAAARRRAQ